jgi:hypothetical protein
VLLFSNLRESFTKMDSAFSLEMRPGHRGSRQPICRRVTDAAKSERSLGTSRLGWRTRGDRDEAGTSMRPPRVGLRLGAVDSGRIAANIQAFLASNLRGDVLMRPGARVVSRTCTQ